jgi:hypothetical protein
MCAQKTYKQPARKAPIVKKPYKIKPVSDKRAAEMAEYSTLKLKFMSLHPKCAIMLENCTHLATDVHHMKGRENKKLLDTQYFLAVCRSCHTYITEHSDFAIKNGFSISRNG